MNDSKTNSTDGMDQDIAEELATDTDGTTSVDDFAEDPHKDSMKDVTENQGGIINEDEVIDANTVGAPADTPGHPGIDEDTA